MIEVIPAIDLIDGKCVRLFRGDFSRRKVYARDPVQIAKGFESFGFKRLHVVDLDGARSGKIKNLAVLEKITTVTNLQIDFGGGVRSRLDVENILSAGASQVSLSSVIVKQKEEVFEWAEKYGKEKFLIGLDVRNEKIALDGWQKQTDIEVFSFLRGLIDAGFTEFFITDISKDGTLLGANHKLYEKVLQSFPRIKLIASGGVSCAEDVRKLARVGCSGVIVGKAIYEGLIKPEDLRCL
ncbi:MAG: 1-(5-phosphoribosyl)-5-[(5-phosphoribosylamino)methylideneamino]imidazole-4-carboxamide isomerase [Pyrinomonadaceae bacterium]|nr:1-(5-phosphoribosyl)-5-[(5-phosphoribosylamino)methylideneamino]imidazole-4-carboxamide isomerase [Pyrinomonadaceae bacterium]MCX7639486.1 1-(5-phosphoribosyl)-5-[(5-phosphoribosylamino)methylideneamino]imidazole-4-carboxamide isomerase [Pyrinomonadaceae bacterium]MDW8304463.1 1-(5-phosphoribosyl)-5-[(5-phosphoribosylamino)methylideneamino]imidazole-4-carboxamide isomerase [Acidobacteriota bacterium]